MSKYIKYKNVYNDNNEEILDTKYWEKMSDNSYATDGYTIFDYEIKKEADTIEELCDEFVLVRKDTQTKLIWHRDFNSLMEDIDTYKEQYDVYGAIWVKGEHDEPILKPVAKMNKDGDLKLI